MRETNCANTEGLFSIIQCVPSPKAEPFKLWLAQMVSKTNNLTTTTTPDLLGEPQTAAVQSIQKKSK